MERRYESFEQIGEHESVVLSTNIEYLRRMKINPHAMAANTHKMTGSSAHEREDYYSPWFAPDEELTRTINVRKMELTRRPDVVVDTGNNDLEIRSAVQELLVLQATHLADTFPDIYQISDNARDEAFIHNKLNGDRYSLAGHAAGTHPILSVGLLGQEDICIVKQLPNDKHVFVAGFVASPTDWNLPDFIGKDMDETHAKYPDYPSKLKHSVDKILASMPPYPERQVVRNNLFITANSSLSIRPDEPRDSSTPITDPGSQIFLRSEYETLTRLPSHREYIVFTIKPHVFPLSTVRLERGMELAEAIQTNPVLSRDKTLASIALSYLI